MKAGILSDTHLTTITPLFRQLAERAFSECDVIIHAGDITNAVIFDVFKGKTVHAVHGNMCNSLTRKLFGEKKVIRIGDYTIGLCHGANERHNIEERLWTHFGEVDCIIYGHTHLPVCEKKGNVLFINPGSFHCTGPYSSPASYATLEIDNSDVKATLHSISA